MANDLACRHGGVAGGCGVRRCSAHENDLTVSPTLATKHQPTGPQLLQAHQTTGPQPREIFLPRPAPISSSPTLPARVSHSRDRELASASSPPAGPCQRRRRAGHGRRATTPPHRRCTLRLRLHLHQSRQPSHFSPPPLALRTPFHRSPSEPPPLPPPRHCFRVAFHPASRRFV
jgi:hypothetical protein